MSGGSFNYLAFKMDSLDTILNSGEDFKSMIEVCRATRNDDIADEIEQTYQTICSLIADAESKLEKERLRSQSLIKAVEWYVSGDYDMVQVNEALAKMKADNKESKL